MTPKSSSLIESPYTSAGNSLVPSPELKATTSLVSMVEELGKDDDLNTSNSQLSPLSKALLDQSRNAELSFVSKHILDSHLDALALKSHQLNRKEEDPTGNLWGEARTILDDMMEEVEYLNASSQHRMSKDKLIIGTEQCFICAEAFGPMRWRRKCKRCQRDVCSECSPHRGHLKDPQEERVELEEEEEEEEGGLAESGQHEAPLKKDIASSPQRR